MKYRHLGKSGLEVSVIGLGTNAFGGRADKASSIRIIHQALDAGLNMIDTANVYTNTQSESIIGDALIGRRSAAILATKGGMPRGEGANRRGATRIHLTTELEGSLRRLQTDYVDLYQVHTFDPHTPLEETLAALDDFISSGKVRYIGASNFQAWELMKSLSLSERHHWAKFISVQPCYSLADRTIEQELIPMCVSEGVGIIPYFPLAGGILTGKYTKDSTPQGSRAEKDPNFAKKLDDSRIELGNQVAQLAEKLGATATTLSLAWLLHQPAVSTVIVGATKVEQLEQNLQAAELELSADTLQTLDEMSKSFVYAPPFAVYRPLG
ncbi:aldo/keto reductase [Alicyclobacillus sp. TC]|uniref:Aryl-alcohol dehydrogenase-like predicted oxidoreductase n=1 Tax=Alicyclobacillus tolerans TaxID=90970 RepID=A0ABT9LUI5_9BACL|nr:MULTISPECIES: aldo/keto reductase [Alicyclobacillus]MDP9727923.1 aryl-alcohol dehydrogenase-like predicted oxidoreductase [Alicyclobacillus tengchongensis]QRF24223.1 aldo/keto reductase [Alicyclobacillus sp. TC]